MRRIKRLGEGGYGEVYKLKDYKSNQFFAVKCFNEDIDQEDIDKECEIFGKMQKLQL